MLMLTTAAKGSSMKFKLLLALASGILFCPATKALATEKVSLTQMRMEISH